jgi:hypothetical protein
VNAAYEALKPRLPAALKPVKVHIFMVPIECVETLTSHFSSLIGAG